MEILDNRARSLRISAAGIICDQNRELIQICPLQVLTAKVFIEIFYVRGKTKSKACSYTLKGCAERFGSYLHQAADAKTESYVSNGAFIFAAFQTGVPILYKEEYSLNCCFLGSFKKCENWELI